MSTCEKLGFFEAALGGGQNCRVKILRSSYKVEFLGQSYSRSKFASCLREDIFGGWLGAW